MIVQEHFLSGGRAILHPINNAVEQSIAEVLDDVGDVVLVG